jgi:hypothetical protein
MNKGVFKWELFGTVIIIILGFIFHFAFPWLNEWKPLAMFFAVNESVWEHTKIGFWPALLFSILEYPFIKNIVNNFWIAKSALLLTVPISIIVLYYTYTGIIGYNLLAIDISIFFISVILGQLVSYKLLIKSPLSKYYNSISLGILLLLIVVFSTLTFIPPHIPLFKDSKSGLYGIPKI